MTGDASPALPDRFRLHADALDRAGRSPLSVAVLRGAAEDIAAGGLTGELLAGIALPAGSVPTLRLLAAVHHLVLAGRAPELAAFYPSAGGDRRPAGVWPVARAALGDEAEWVRGRLGRTVQTNDPGRAAVLFPGLLYLVDRWDLPIRLLEIGASAGLNLLADRFSYVDGGAELGAAGSAVRFVDPWRPGPDIDRRAAAGRLRIVEREGCDLAPLDPRDPGDRLTVVSYIWPDEGERIGRMWAALELAAGDPAPVVAAPAEDWLCGALAGAEDGQLTVVWQSVMRQYVPAGPWAAIEAAIGAAQQAGRRVAWLRMERRGSRSDPLELTISEAAGEPERRLARCDDHGPPVAWDVEA